MKNKLIRLNAFCWGILAGMFLWDYMEDYLKEGEQDGTDHSA